MLSIGVISPSGAGYYMETVGSGLDDYYARAEPGRWLGAGSRALGLAGLVEAAQIDALVAGRHPLSGEALGLRTGKVAAFDLTFSAPKSVSLLAELADLDVRRGVVEAHRAAVGAAVGFLEDEHVLVARRGAAGARQVPTVGALAAAFEHRSSRAGDPQLHTHLLLFNRAEGADGRWGGIDGRRLFGWAKTAGYLYQAALRAELTERLEVAWRPVVNGIADLAGVTDSQLEEFSTRRRKITAALEQAGQSSARAAQVATLHTRPAKPEPLDPDAQRDAWRERAARVGLDAGQVEAVCGRDRHIPAPPGDLEALAAELASPLDGLTARRSSFDRRDVLRAVAERSSAGAHPAQVRATADRVLADRRMAATGTTSRLAGALYSTAELLAVEARLLAERDAWAAGPPRAVCAAAHVDAAIAARASLSDEQQRMVRRLCGSGQPLEVVVGRAGTGKTYALDAARDAWGTAGVPVVGAALAARAAAALQAGTGIPSTTVDQLLIDAGRPGPGGGLPAGGVLVVDEAGMVGTRKLAALLDAARRARAKVVLVGDPRQLPEVEAGGAFAALAARDAIELSVNRRQASAWERAALDELRHGDVARAVTVYRDHRRITLAPTLEAAVDQLVGDWWAACARHGFHQAVMVALGRAEVDRLNEAARSRLLAAGRLEGPALRCEAGREFAVGDQVMALRNDRRLGLNNGTRALVVALDPVARAVTVDVGAGRRVRVGGAYLDAGHLAHAYAFTAHKAQGLTVARAFVLGTDRMYREAGYTTMSRATERSDLYQVAPPPPRWQPAVDPHRDLARRLSRPGAQTLASVDAGLDLTAIRDAALADPEPHLVARLGPPPTFGAARDAWAAAATAIDAYRQRHGITEPDPLGTPPADPDARRQYDHAVAAARQFDRQLETGLDRGLSI